MSDISAPTIETPAEGPKQDPRKRDQIMQGARKVFLEMGFDAASMNDIAKAAGVSKGTLYVYFENKERLFVELISQEKQEEFFSILQLDETDPDIETVLARFGFQVMQILTRPYYIQAMRTVFSIVNRMPEIGAEFYSRGPQKGQDHLTRYLGAQVAAGHLAIDDIDTATHQFFSLAQGNIFRRILIGASSTPTPEQLESHTRDAARLFLKAYEAR